MAKKDTNKIKHHNTESKSTTKSATTTLTPSISFFEEIKKSFNTALIQYKKDLADNQKLRLIDIFLAFLVCVGIVQFGFCIIGGSFPFNAFLSGFSATVGQFVLTVSLRLQSSESNSKLFNGLLPERAFGEYIFASLLLHFVLIHFIN